ncbi:hypothetical protein HDV04_004094 [Boothiomyces sp. JEL0838]|nr:hypothetical protein HDV04_004081 [Boothiomyces sp. JEL0838]KAJ3311382.1 hypothetical protein HDV04_004094 [Boothiomyces sp. JEL0838]
MIGDLATDLHTRSWGYAIYGGVFGITGMIGPIIGGIFAPRSSCTEGVFCTFPFLAILLIGSGIVFVAFFLGSFLPTTPPGYTAVEDEVDVESNQGSTYENESNTGRIEEGESVIDENEAMVNTQSNPESIASIVDRNTFLILLLYCIIAFVNTNYKVGIPLYFSADETNGGLGYDASYISGSFAFLAGAKLTSQLLLFAPLVKFYQSPIKVYRLGMLLYIPLHLVFPFMVYVQYSRSILVIWTMISLGLCESISYLSIILLITESQKRHLGLVHGISTTMTALVYIISPAIAGGLWKVGVLYHIPWIDFIFGSFLSFLAVVLSFFIKD